MTPRLHINIDHVATLRNARGTSYPDPVLAAGECLRAGADGITAHLREDRRHIVDADIERLRGLDTVLNMEMAATDEIELHTGEYANATAEQAARELEALAEGARLAHSLELEVAAGHGLTQANVVALMRIPEVVELNIGHAVVADAIFLSLAGAVRAMREAVARGLALRPA